MSLLKKLSLFALFFILLIGCSAPEEQILPTLVPTLEIAQPTLPPVGEGELRIYPTIEYENPLLGLKLSHPENWELREIGSDQFRLVPDSNTVNEFESFVSPAISIQSASTANIPVEDSVDISDPAEILEGLIAQFNFEFSTLEEIKAQSINTYEGATMRYEQTLPALVSEDVDPEEVEESSIISELTVLINDEQFVSIIFSASTDDFEIVAPVFDDLKATVELLGIPENPTE